MTLLSIYGYEVITVDRSCTGCDCAGWPLSVIILVPGNPMFGTHLRPSHLEQIELRRYLKQCTGIIRQTMHLSSFTSDCTDLQVSRQLAIELCSLA